VAQIPDVTSSRSTKTETPRCVPQSRDAPEATYRSRRSRWTFTAITDTVSLPIREVWMATKDKNTKKSMEKKPAQKTLKEKRQAKRAKK